MDRGPLESLSFPPVRKDPLAEAIEAVQVESNPLQDF